MFTHYDSKEFFLEEQMPISIPTHNNLNSSSSKTNYRTLTKCNDKAPLLEERDTQQNFHTDESGSKPLFWPQLLACLVGSMNSFTGSIMMFFTGVTLPQMMNPASQDIVLDVHQASLFSSIIQFGSALGCLASTPIAVMLGQKVTSLLCIPIAAIGWIILGQTSSFTMLISMRMIHGLVHGMFYPCAFTYILETSHYSVRGRLMVIAGIVAQLANIFLFAVGNTSFTWRNIALICGALPFILPFLGFLYLPSSPRWLCTKERYDDAYSSLVFFRGKRYHENTAEFRAIVEDIKKKGSSKTFNEQFKLLSERSIYKRVIMLSILNFVQIFSGNTTLLSFLTRILQSLDLGFDEYLLAFIFILTGFVGACISLLVVDRFGRKPPMVISTFLFGVCLIIFSIFLSISSYDKGISLWPRIALINLIASNLFINICIPISEPLSSELLPNSVRSITTPIVITVNYIAGFLSVLSYEYFVNILGIEWTFVFYGLNAFISALITMFCIPETRGKSLEEIEAYFT